MENVMELEELGNRLAALEEAQRAKEAEALQASFMDKYGARFNNNPDLSVAILNELNRRGVDVSAADDAVQGILDQLRMELTECMDQLQQMMSDISTEMDKVNKIDEAVMAASDQGAPAPAPDMPAEETPAPTPDMPAPDMPAPDMGTPAPTPDMGAPAPDMGVPQASELPPMPPQTVPSDSRIKTNIRVARPTARPAQKPSFSSSLISAARGL